MIDIALILVCLNQLGKAGTHATRIPARGFEWVREPLIKGLAITDLYHVFSALEWPFLLFACWSYWGLSIEYWAAAIIIWGTIWPLSKILKGLTVIEAFHETWYMQIITWIFVRR